MAPAPQKLLAPSVAPLRMLLPLYWLVVVAAKKKVPAASTRPITRGTAAAVELARLPVYGRLVL